jgi:hypothetical protein
MTPDKYGRFVAEKAAAIASIDRDPTPITSTRPPAPVFALSVSTDGLADPSHIFVTKKAREEEFEKRLAGDSENPIPEPPKPERETLDYRRFGLQRETRFFDGGAPLPKGKRYFTSARTFDSARTIVSDFD